MAMRARSRVRWFADGMPRFHSDVSRPRRAAGVAGNLAGSPSS
ncbi:MAG TPA: hypothetical protein VLH81_01225 [Desulfobacterales bacterium]|nr:hypothetical protein [Desulfobacterales bacterium]